MATFVRRESVSMFSGFAKLLLLLTCAAVLYRDTALQHKLRQQQVHLGELQLQLAGERDESGLATAAQPLALPLTGVRKALEEPGSKNPAGCQQAQLRPEQQPVQQPDSKAQHGEELAKLAQQHKEALAGLKWHKGQEESLLQDGRLGMYGDTQVLRSYLKSHQSQLGGAWAGRLAQQAQRGILMAAGGRKSVPVVNVFVTLHVLRHHLKCTLPVAILYYGGLPSDNIDDKTQKFFKEHLEGIEFIDASKLPYPEYHRPLFRHSRSEIYGWKAKVFSLYVAPFKEVLFLDSDSMPLLDPTALFELPQYQQHGNLFWPAFFVEDIQGTHYQMKPLYDTLKLESPWADPRKTVHQTEAGQFLFDRSKHWEVLEWLLFLNIRDEVTYKLVHGDKDTFRAAFSLARKADEFQLVPVAPAFILSEGTYKGILQFHPNGTAMFAHRTPKKYSLRKGALPPTTHVSASASGRSAEDPVGHLILFQQLWKHKTQAVAPSQCKYTLKDWPGAQRACAPAHDVDMRKEQPLPVFEAPQGSHLAAAEAAADAGFTLVKAFKW
ncbi:hypothetical protein N2152v2_005106 [Parachlorella kessleri]